MKKKTEISKQETTPKRGGLRLIRSDEETPKEAPPKGLHGKNNSLVKFMDSYADAIDQEIKVLLEL